MRTEYQGGLIEFVSGEKKYILADPSNYNRLSCLSLFAKIETSFTKGIQDYLCDF